MGTSVLELGPQAQPGRNGSHPWLRLVAVTLLVGLLVWALVDATRTDPDEAWAALRIEGSEVEHYKDLPTMIASSDLIVFGEIETVTPGRTFGSEGDTVSYANLGLRVDEAIRGRRPPSGVVTLEVLLTSSVTVDQLQSDLPGQQGIYFLRNKGEEARRLGDEPEEVRTESNYWRVVSSQGLFANDDGVVSVPLWMDQGFPQEYVGRDFGATLREVRGRP